MFDAVSPSDQGPSDQGPSATPSVLQRARGALDVTLRRRGAETVLAGLRQEGCLKARFPRGGAAGWCDVVMLNSSGGVAGGDRLALNLRLRPGARACLAAQAAERFYRALPDSAPARVATAITLDAGAAAEWLPQETILFDGAALERRLDVAMPADGWFLGVEQFVFGRAAMGETMRHGLLRDTIRIHRAGYLLLHDAMRLAGDIAATLARPAVAAGARAVATLVLVAPDAEARLADVRSALEGTEAGASAWDGMLLARLLAADAAALRRMVSAALAVLRGPRSLPRVWRC
jgi:urease accessory protein